MTREPITVQVMSCTTQEQIETFDFLGNRFNIKCDSITRASTVNACSRCAHTVWISPFFSCTMSENLRMAGSLQNAQKITFVICI